MRVVATRLPRTIARLVQDTIIYVSIFINVHIIRGRSIELNVFGDCADIMANLNRYSYRN